MEIVSALSATAASPGRIYGEIQREGTFIYFGGSQTFKESFVRSLADHQFNRIETSMTMHEGHKLCNNSWKSHKNSLTKQNAAIPEEQKNQRASQVALVVKNPPASAGDVRDVGWIPGSGRSPGGGHEDPLQCSYLGNPMDRGTLWATVLKVAKNQT